MKEQNRTVSDGSVVWVDGSWVGCRVDNRHTPYFIVLYICLYLFCLVVLGYEQGSYPIPRVGRRRGPWRGPFALPVKSRPGSFQLRAPGPS